MKILIQTFNNIRFGKLRGMNIDGEAWLMGVDVARRLGYKNPQKAIRDHVEDEDKTLNESFTVNGTTPTLINESGLYSLILSSKLPQAKDFKRWVTAEVLPQIRRTGGYIPTHDLEGRELTAEEMMAKTQEIFTSTLAQKDQQISYQQRQLEAQQPMVLFYGAVASSSATCSVAELAKMLQANGVAVGQNRLFVWLRSNGYLCVRGGAYYNTPYQQWVESGLFRIETHCFEKANGKCLVSYTTRVTGKGVQYFVDGFLSGRFVI